MSMADNNLEEMYPDRVSQIFENKTIFITGGTGFLGKVLVEKLLRLCPKVAKIYLLIREKKGKSHRDRLHEQCKDPLFDLLKKLHGNSIVNKVHAIAGDVCEENLGMSAEDRERIAKEVEIIYHIAATIRFDEGLKKAVILNVRGVKYLLDFAKECKELKILVHTSTAYCQLSKVLEEKAYPPPNDPHKLINICEMLSDDDIEKITKFLIGEYPNTYAFTKALGESLVVDEMENLPVVIIRPSIVTPIKDGPIPGWTDNINGPAGLLIGAGKGVIRTMYCNPKAYGDFVPVDLVCTVHMLVPFFFLTTKAQRIFNCTSSSEHKVSWNEITDMGRELATTKYPFNSMLWYPGGSLKSSKFYHLICFYLYQWIPALFIDALLILLRYKPFMMRVQRRIYKGYEIFEYYTTKQWEFKNADGFKLREILNPLEKSRYVIEYEASREMYYKYFGDCIRSARIYLMKETDDELPAARRNVKVMWLLDRVTRIVLVLLFVIYVVPFFFKLMR